MRPWPPLPALPCSGFCGGQEAELSETPFVFVVSWSGRHARPAGMPGADWVGLMLMSAAGQLMRSRVGLRLCICVSQLLSNCGSLTSHVHPTL